MTNTITLNAVGDMMFGNKVGDAIAKKGADYLFDHVKTTLASADLVFGNLECPLSERGIPDRSKIFTFSGSPFIASSLKQAGFNVLSLANNHILDYGPSALYDTMSLLEQHKISHVGAGRNLQEATKPLIVDVKDVRVAFLAFSSAFQARRTTPGCAPFNQKHIQKNVESVKSDADLIIVSIHQGVEYTNYPGRFAIKLFRSAVDAGAHLVLGHHPHVVQGIEIYKDSLIAYSLGNFIFDFINEERRREAYQKTALAYFTNHPPDINDMRTTESMILQCKLNRKDIMDYKLIPVKSNIHFQPVLMDEKECQIFNARVQQISSQFSHPTDPIWDEMDKLWEKCKELSFQDMKFNYIIKKIHHFRPKHLNKILPFLKAKIKKVNRSLVLKK